MMQAATHFYAKDCRDFEDGNEVQTITRWGETDEDAGTFSHPPDLQVSFDCFAELTGETVAEGFCGRNGDVVFWYDPHTDIHRFYTPSGRL